MADTYYVIEGVTAPVQDFSTPTKEKAEVIAADRMSSYVVQKGDTLEKIAAKPEVYGDKKKWYSIYKENKDTIKNPDKIKPGQVLRIPW